MKQDPPSTTCNLSNPEHEGARKWRPLIELELSNRAWKEEVRKFRLRGQFCLSVSCLMFAVPGQSVSGHFGASPRQRGQHLIIARVYSSDPFAVEGRFG